MTGLSSFHVGAAVAGMVSSVLGFLTAEVQMESQAKMAKRNYDHTDTMGKIDRDMKMAQLSTQERQQQITKDGAVAYNHAVEERKRAEDGKKIMDARIAQLNLNRRTGNLRNQPAYGTPTVTV